MDVERTIEFILEQQAKTEAILTKMAERQDRTDAKLDRAILLAVREARTERWKRREMDARWDEKMTQLAAAQLVTEEKVQKLSDKIDAIVELRRNGGNGHPPV